jgi:hypothetical protein
MVMLDPDFQFLHPSELFFREQDVNPLQVICQHLQSAGSIAAMLSFKQLWINVDGPALDFLYNGIEPPPLDLFRRAVWTRLHIICDSKLTRCKHQRIPQ